MGSSNTNTKGDLLSPLEQSLKASLLPPEPRDVRLHAFARRTRHRDGTVHIDRPLPIVAIGSVLEAKSEHFAKRQPWGLTARSNIVRCKFG